MPIETVTVQYINQPKQKGWSGSIKTDKGYFGVKEADLSKFRKDEVYVIEFSTTSRNGKEYRDFVRIVPQATESAQENKSRDIFVSGVTQYAMSSGKFEISDIKSIALAAASAWDVLHGKEEEYDPGAPPGYETGDPMDPRGWDDRR